jgi:hypothetical protein
MRDLARMARDGGAPLVGRGTTDPNVLADYDFYVKNGITREGLAARNAEWQRSDAEASVLADYHGPIPGDVVGEFRGLRGPRLEWARFGAWRDRTAAELVDLEATKARLNDIVQAPSQTESKIVAAVKRTARLLLGSGTDDDSGERHDLDKKLATERHRSEAAAQALPEVEMKIEAKRKQFDILVNRTGEFLRPAMISIFEESGIGRIHARKKAEFEAVDNLVGSFLRGYTDHTTPDCASLAAAPRVEIGWHHSWGEIENALRKDARAEVGKLLPKLKAA